MCFVRDFKRNSDSWRGIGGDYEVRDTLQVARVWNVANMNTNAAKYSFILVYNFAICIHNLTRL